MKQIIKKSLFWGSTAGLLLLVLYFLILSLANSFSHALEQFQIFYPWLLLLTIGFGIQVGLYSYIRQKIKQKQTLDKAKKEVAALGGVSSASMVACCAHHLVDVLPIFGFSVLFLFLAKYQLFFLVLGIAGNIIGIIFMLEIIKKHSLFEKESFLTQAAAFNLTKIKKLAVIIAGVVLLIVFVSTKNSGIKNQSAVLPSVPDVKPLAPEYQPNLIENDNDGLSAKINNEGGLSIEAEPIDFTFGLPVKLKIALNTHQGDLSFDLAEKAVLLDEKGSQYLPLEWQGGSGGHHLSGVLIFPALTSETKKITLKIFDVYEIKEREFLWNLK